MTPTSRFVSDLLRKSARTLALGATTRLSTRYPELMAAMLVDPQSHPTEDIHSRILHLVEAVLTDRPELFLHEIAWQRQALPPRDIPEEYLRHNLDCLRQELLERIAAQHTDIALGPVDAAMNLLDQAPEPTTTPPNPSDAASKIIHQFILATLEGRPDDAISLIENAMQGGASANDLHQDVLQPVQQEIGRMWQIGEINIAEEHLASRTVERSLNLIRERSPKERLKNRRALTASVSGNLHDIGLRMVADQLELNGWQVIHIGANLPISDAVQAAIDFDVHLIALATTLVPQVSTTLELIEALRKEPKTTSTPILVGGPPFQIAPDLHEVLGADATASTAREAVAQANRLSS